MTTDHKLQRAKSLSSQALLAAFLAIATVVWRLRLWHFDLRVPLAYWGDALYETTLVKALSESYWNYYIDRLSAPFGMDAVDFPIGCTIDFALIKLGSVCISAPGLLVNCYWLLTIAMASGFAALFLSSLRVSDLTSAVFGALYGFVPFVFYRNIAHLNLVHYTIPGVLFVAVSLAKLTSVRRLKILQKKYHIGTIFFGVSLAVGLAYIYWAFFACVAIAVGGIIATIRSKRLAGVIVAACCAAIIVLTATASISATLLYWYRHGYNNSLAYKNPTEADTFGLTIRQMVTPIPRHPFRVLAYVRDKIVSARFPNDLNEGSSAELGTIATAGFLLLMLAAVARTQSGILGDGRIQTLSGLAIALVLFAHAGGFGSVFNAVAFHEFRAYNRISPFVGLLSLAAVAIVLDRWLVRQPAYICTFVLAPLLAIAAFDQVPAVLFADQHSREALFHHDQQFIAKLEAQLPGNAMVFQLPNTEFPLDGPRERMLPYDNARAYLHSATLHWSWGAMSGRHHNWASNVARLPADQLARQLTLAGFSGVLLDRDGYATREVENTIRAAVGDNRTLDVGQRWVYYDFGSVRHRLQTEFGLTDWPLREQAARYPIFMTYGGSLSGLERYGAEPFCWSGVASWLLLNNEANADRVVEVSGKLKSASAESHIVTVSAGSETTQLRLSPEGTSFSQRIKIRPHSSAKLAFSYDGPPLATPPGEHRELAFLLTGFSWRELGDSGEEIDSGS